MTPAVVGPVNNDGIGTSTFHFARVLAEAGHTISIFFTGSLAPHHKARWRKHFASFGIGFIALSDAPRDEAKVYGSSWSLERSWRVFQYLKRARFGIVHFQDWQANGFWSIKAKRVGLAFSDTILTVMAHSCTDWVNRGMQQFGADPFETAKLMWAEAYAMEHCDVLFSPSRYMFEWLAENGIEGPKRRIQAPYPCTDRVPPAGTGGETDNDHLIFFGRLETRKGLHVLGQALRQMRTDGASLPKRLSFVGKHGSVLGIPSADYLKSLRRDLGVSEFRVFHNLAREEALKYIRESRGLVVMPSLADNYPLAVIECIWNGIPFLAAGSGGISEMIDARASFEPTPAALAALLIARQSIAHGQMRHKYSASASKKTWCDLHDGLLAELHAPDRSSQRRRRPPSGRKVSVCIPFYNHQSYLPALVSAFSAQSYPDFEVILVNDGSSAEATRAFDRIAAERRDSRFKFLTTENRGPGPARNLAVDQGSGELLIFFDADNLPKDGHFVSTLVRALEESDADCVTCSYDIVPEDVGVPTEDRVMAASRPIGPCLEAGFFENVLGDTAMIVKRTVFQELGGWSASRAFTWEDHAFLLNLCFKGFKLESVPESLFYYRQGGRNERGNAYLNYVTIFRRLKHAPSADLARIVERVAGPMLISLRNPGVAATIVPAWDNPYRASAYVWRKHMRGLIIALTVRILPERMLHSVIAFKRRVFPRL